jgi:hypothetical protein
VTCTDTKGIPWGFYLRRSGKDTFNTINDGMNLGKAFVLQRHIKSDLGRKKSLQQMGIGLSIDLSERRYLAGYSTTVK